MFYSLLFSSLRMTRVERRDYTRINYYIKYILFSSLLFTCPKSRENRDYTRIII